MAQSEKELEDKLIEQLKLQGYESVTIADEDSLLKNFKIKLQEFNKIDLSDKEFNRIVTHLEGGSIFDKAKKLRDKYELQRDDGEVIYVKFFDSKEWCKNLFQVTNQITVNGTYVNRYDVTLLINGLPLVQIELKRKGIELKEAYNQIKRYDKHSYRGLFNYIQIFVISNGVNTKYYANNKELSFKFTFFWTDDKNKKFSNLEDFTLAFLEKCHIGKMIAKYTVLAESTKSLFLLRPYQFYAVEKIIDRVENTNKNGYIWHTTGSGKTLTSFKTAQILSENEKVDKIIFIVDRNDLDTQTRKEFNSFSENSVDGTDNTNQLVKKLENSKARLIITTIQKLNKAITTARYSHKMDSIKDKNIVLIFDECHRSQFGDMHTNITGFFNKIQYFGFTGTPIFDTNKGANNKTTSDIFGERLHTYTIKNAINDENVLGFSVEYIQTFKGKEIADLEVEGIDTKEVLEAPERLNLITDYILQNHNKKTLSNSNLRNFTAIFATPNIPTLTKYYDLFKEKNSNLNIAAIFSFNPNEEDRGDEHSRDTLERIIEDYNKKFETNYSTKKTKTPLKNEEEFDRDMFDSYAKDVGRKVKERKIDILLVVNMFLTGFDSKYLNTLYVDKNLQYHGLLQAYSRTNRVLDEVKHYGNIVNFRNLKTKTDDAIKLFSSEDTTAIDTVLMKSFAEYVKDFNKAHEILVELAPSVQAVDDLPDEDAQYKFVQAFREILRVLTRLKTFTDFSFDDIPLTEQEINDYQSKYLDIYERVRNNTEKQKISILDDIDFEIELLRTDKINVLYILSLLRDLDPKSKSYIKDKEFILKSIDTQPDLKSKKELFEKFINENIGIASQEELETDILDFFEKEREKEIDNLVSEEQLLKEKIKELITDYEFSNKFRDEYIKDSLIEKLGIVQRKKKVETIKQKLTNILSKFSLNF